MISDPVTSVRYRVVDIHQHLSADDSSETVAERLRILAEAGIDHAVLLPPSGAFGQDAVECSEINRQTSLMVKAHPVPFLCGVARVRLSDGEDRCLREIEYAVQELGLRGVAWHHRFEGVSIDHPTMPALVRKCASLGVPALIHAVAGSSLEASWRLERLLERCDGASVVVLDAFSGVDRAEETIAIAERHPNVSCDLGAMVSIAGWLIQKFLEVVGPERLMLGTDLYLSPRTWYSPAPLHEIRHMDIGSEEKRLILSENALRTFGLGRPEESVS